MPSDATSTEVVAVIVGLHHDTPYVLTVNDGCALPRGPLLADHRSLQVSLRAWVERLTGFTLGYVEQLYTFADRHRLDGGTRVISVSYLGLTRINILSDEWRPWYAFFPWEDQREPAETNPTTAHITPPRVAAHLQPWIDAAPDDVEREARHARVHLAFGHDTASLIQPELCLTRYELLYEAGVAAEAGAEVPPEWSGQHMELDHRRIVATGMARLRAKIQYRPVVFELMPAEFTLGQLQRSVEALSGCAVHKQNFRRLIEQHHLVEDTGRTMRETGGRPAKLVRFRRDVLSERQAVGTKLPIPRAR